MHFSRVYFAGYLPCIYLLSSANQEFICSLQKTKQKHRRTLHFSVFFSSIHTLFFNFSWDFWYCFSLSLPRGKSEVFEWCCKDRMCNFSSPILSSMCMTTGTIIPDISLHTQIIGSLLEVLNCINRIPKQSPAWPLSGLLCSCLLFSHLESGWCATLERHSLGRGLKKRQADPKKSTKGSTWTFMNMFHYKTLV